MSKTLKINNFASPNIIEDTQLRSTTPAGSATLDVENNQGFVATDFLIVGTLGSEDSELLTVSSVAGANTITPLTSTKLDYSAYIHVTKLFGNQLCIYRAANVNGLQPLDSEFTKISTINIDVDQPATLYTDPSGSTDYWYKSTYFNPTTNAESPLSDSKAARGDAYCSIEDIRNSGVKSKYITDAEIDEKRQAAQAEINSALAGIYQVPFTKPINPFIVDLTIRLAAGLVLTSKFGTFSTLNNTNGTAMLVLARKQLVQLQTSQMTLTDTVGTPINIPNEGSFAGWPNDTTDGTDPSLAGDNGPTFRKSMRY